MDTLEKYKVEVIEKWGETAAYMEHTQKTKNYSKEKFDDLASEMYDILAEFSLCMKNGEETDSKKVQNLVDALKKHITENYYLCTNEILAGLGKIYISDKRFKENIDKHAKGAAEFISKAIEIYCNK